MNFTWQLIEWVKRWLGQGRATFIVVWGTWLTLFVLALVFTHRYALRMPSCDDWTHLADMLTGRTPVTLSKLWSQTHEHRLPLIHAIVLSLAWLTGGAFHVENFVNVAVLAGLAAVLIEAARRARGSLRCTDAFFPLALLNLGHVDLFVSRLMLNHVLSAALMGLALCLMVCQQGPLSVRRALLLGGLLLCLPLCGANGLPVVLLGAAWLVLGARAGAPVDESCDSGMKRRRLVHFAVAGVLVLLLGCYFLGYQSPRQHGPPADVGAFLRTCGQAMAVSFAFGAPEYWPWTGLVVPVLATATFGLLGWVVWTQPTERARALGLFLFLVAAAGIVVGLSWGRARIGAGAGGASRYGIVTIPVLLAVYLSWVAHGPRTARRFIQVGLLLLFALGFLPNWKLAHLHGKFLREQDRAMARALGEGAPPAAVVAYGEGIFVPPGVTARSAARMLGLQQVGLGPFQGLQPEPRWHETPVSLTPAAAARLAWDGRCWEAHEPHSTLLFRLPKPQFVHAIRLRFDLPHRAWPGGTFDVFWDEEHRPSNRPQHATYVVHARRKGVPTLTVWVNQTIDRIRIDPSPGPCRFELHEITLLRKREEETRFEAEGVDR